MWRSVLSRLLWIILAVWARDGSAEEHAVHELFTEHPFLAQQARQCRGSGGLWHGGWVHCQCPAGTLYQTDTGCVEVFWADGVAAKQNWTAATVRQGVRTLLAEGQGLQVMLAPTEIDAFAYATLATAFNADPSRVLTGLTLPPRRSRYRTVVILSPATAASRQQVEREDALQNAQVVSFDPLFGLQNGADSAAIAAQCSAAASAMPCATEALAALSRTGSVEAKFIKAVTADVVSVPRSAACPLRDAIQARCRNLTAAHAHLTTPRDKPWRDGPVVSHISGARSCDGECSLTVRFGADAHAVVYNVVLADGVPLRRALRVASAGNVNEPAVELLALFAPSGTLDVLMIKSRAPALEASGAVLRRERWLYNGQGALLQHTHEALGARDALDAALVGWYGPNRLITDRSWRTPLWAPLRAVVIDTGIDPRVPGLRHRLAIPYGTDTSWFIADAGSGFAWFPSPGLGLLTLFDERGHGTRVASVIASDLPLLRLHALRGDDVGFVALETLQRSWLAFLTQVQPHVVNISQDWSRMVPDCARFFGPIVAAMPQTLFIAGAGNDGTSVGGQGEQKGACPASLTAHHANLLAVAGSDGAALDPQSNRGPSVSVAANMHQWAVRFATSEHHDLGLEPDGAMSKEIVYGTSFAAAAVSNAALRWAARLQDRGVQLSGAELAAAVQRFCVPMNMAVACGGPVSLWAMEHTEP